MRKRRRLYPHRSKHVDLPSCVVQVIIAAYNVRDVHLHVIHNNGEIVGWAVVLSSDDQIVQLGVLENHPASHLVIDDDFAVLGILETNYRTNAPSRFCTIAATTVIAKVAA